MYRLKDKSYVSKQDVKLIISRLIFEIMEENKPYVWNRTIEAFEDQIGVVSFDYSGEVNPMTYQDLLEIGKKLCTEEYVYYGASIKVVDFLNQIYTNKWEIGFNLSKSKNWLTYKRLLEYKFMDWKIKQIDYKFKDTAEYTQNVDEELQDILYEFLCTTSYEIYYAKLTSRF